MDWCSWKTAILVGIAAGLVACHKGDAGGGEDGSSSDVTTNPASGTHPPTKTSKTTGAPETDSTSTSPTVTTTKGNQIGTASAGCGKTANTGFSANNTLDVNGTSRTYDIFVPPTYDASQKIRVVFVLHADTGISLRPYFPIEQASGGKAIIVYPHGMDNGAWDLSAASDNADYTFMQSLRGAIEDNYCVDKDRVFGFGYSQGAFLANMMACYRGASIFNAISVAEGGLYAPDGEPQNYDDNGNMVCPADPVAALVIHGTQDTQVSYKYDGLPARDTWLTANQCSTETDPMAPASCVTYKGCQKGLVGFCNPNTNHYLWSDAATATWNFFSKL